MHISSAAFLLLLVPATRAAAIPNQGGLSITGDSLINKGDLPNAAINDVLGPAAARRDEAANLRGPKSVEGVSKGAVNTVSDLVISERDAPSPVSAEKVVNNPVDEVVGQSDNILKNSIRQEERDDTESQLREYIAKALPKLDAAQAELLLAELLAASKDNSLKVMRDTGGVAGVTNAIGGVEEIDEGSVGTLTATVGGEDSIDAAAVAQGSLYFPSHQSRGLTSAQLDQIKALADAATAGQGSIGLPSHQSRQFDGPVNFLTTPQVDELDVLLEVLSPQ
ncbi:hypothetical protein V498_01445 [Pseudogymnoascus sp. VKM F-4517 (FW-2822)]|nr:hypothetical protein V498_01445 [Pseudogymnoascus sp. VKM F-4517 (FW-2822)]